MQVSVHDQRLELLVQTVQVRKNHHSEDNLVMFSCPYCAERVVQIQGTVTKIAPGLVPTDRVIIVNKGYHCKLKYVILEGDSDRDFAKITLNSYETDYRGGHIFNCYICRTPLISFDHHQFHVLPVARPYSLPISLTCLNMQCQTKYLFTDII